MLENAERDGYSDIISWMPDGKSFKIHVDGSNDEDDEKAFVAILKETFNQTRFKSFLRQLQLYGFERTYKGPRRGECKHGMFVRGRRELLHKKAIQDFQQEANDSSRSPKSVRRIFQAPTPIEVTSSMPKNDSYSNSFALPLFAPMSRVVSGGSECLNCTYTQRSLIPTKLINLVLPESDKSVKEAEEADEIFSLPMNHHLIKQKHEQVDADVISIHSCDDVPYWTSMELQMLKHAL
jgi:hypothetical protein